MIMLNKNIKIAHRLISESSPCFIIAEAGVNHNGSINTAKKLIDLAVSVKADAVKFQAFSTENLILSNVEKAPYQTSTTGTGETQFEMLKKLELSFEALAELKAYCEQLGIIFLCTPFDESSLDILEKLDVQAYKIASTDLTNIAFLRKIAKTNKPIILSTGMSFMKEVGQAVNNIKVYNQNLIVLQCTGNYPMPVEEANLNVIPVYQTKFDCLVGYSDHSEGVGIAPYTIPLGVKVIEKHFTLDKDMQGPDHSASLSPEELKEFVFSVRQAELAMGTGEKQPTKSEQATRRSLQKSLVARCEIKKGEAFTELNLTAKRTGGQGISSILVDSLIGSLAERDYAPDQVIEEQLS